MIITWLGEEEEGWKLADQVFAADGYNVLAYNLITLRDRVAGFKTLEGDGFVVRMDQREAALYGPRVLSLLSRAKKTLAAKYGAKVAEPVVVASAGAVPDAPGVVLPPLQPARMPATRAGMMKLCLRIMMSPL